MNMAPKMCVLKVTLKVWTDNLCTGSFDDFNFVYYYYYYYYY